MVQCEHGSAAAPMATRRHHGTMAEMDRRGTLAMRHVVGQWEIGSALALAAHIDMHQISETRDGGIHGTNVVGTR